MIYSGCVNKKPLKKAIEIAGGVTSFAEKMNERPNTISMWLQRGVVPSEKVIPASKAVDFEVPPHELRPDLYPHPQDGLPEDMRCACVKDAA